MEENVERFPRLKAFLWTVSSRNMNGKKYNIAKIEELEINKFIFKISLLVLTYDNYKSTVLNIIIETINYEDIL